MSDARFYVYEHRRADTGAVFYVGKGQGRRAYVASPHHHSEHWLRVVSKAGGFNVSFVAKDIDEDLAFLVERERIDQAKRQGVALCNHTDGGEGTSGWPKSEQWRRKVGQAHRGKTIPPETRAKISASVRASGYRHSEETRRRMSASQVGHTRNIGRSQPQEERDRRAAKLVGNRSRTGQVRSLEERRKTSMAMLGRQQGTLVCPHCARSGGNAMRRWHFDNCRDRT